MILQAAAALRLRRFPARPGARWHSTRMRWAGRRWVRCISNSRPGRAAWPIRSSPMAHLDLAQLQIEDDYYAAGPASPEPGQARLQLDLGGPSPSRSTGALDHVPDGPAQMLNGLAVAAAHGRQRHGVFAVHAMPVDKLPGFWPPSLSGHTRTWIQTNMAGGAIDELHMAVEMAVQPGADNAFDVKGFFGAMSIKERQRRLPAWPAPCRRRRFDRDLPAEVLELRAGSAGQASRGC